MNSLQVKYKLHPFGRISGLLFLVLVTLLIIGKIMATGSQQTSIILALVLIILLIYLYVQLRGLIPHYYEFSENGIQLINRKEQIEDDIPLDYITSWKISEVRNRNEVMQYLDIETIVGSVQINDADYANFKECIDFVKSSLPDKENAGRELYPKLSLPEEGKFRLYYAAFSGIILYGLIYIIYAKNWNHDQTVIHKGTIKSFRIISGSRQPDWVEVTIYEDSLSLYRLEGNYALREFRRKNTLRNTDLQIGKKIELEVSKNQDDWYRRYPLVAKFDFLCKGFRYFTTKDFKLSSYYLDIISTPAASDTSESYFPDRNTMHQK